MKKKNKRSLKDYQKEFIKYNKTIEKESKKDNINILDLNNSLDIIEFLEQDLYKKYKINFMIGLVFGSLFLVTLYFKSTIIAMLMGISMAYFISYLLVHKLLINKLNGMRNYILWCQKNE